METASLKSFATSARTELIREVAARITAVLAPGSSERVEKPRPLPLLEKAVTAAGGGDKGLGRRWPIRSPIPGSTGSSRCASWMPTVHPIRHRLARAGARRSTRDARRGEAGRLRHRRRPAKTQEMIAALLNGTRPSQGPPGEAYGLLLEAYCRLAQSHAVHVRARGRLHRTAHSGRAACR